jgi:hypothetical protein
MPAQFGLVPFQPHNAALDAVTPALHGQEAVSTAMIGRRVIFQGSSQDDHMDAVRSTASMNAVIGLDNRGIALTADSDQDTIVAHRVLSFLFIQRLIPPAAA